MKVSNFDFTEAVWQTISRTGRIRAVLGAGGSRIYRYFALKLCHMISVCELHNRFIQLGGNLSFLKWSLENPDSYAAKKFNQINYSSSAEKMWSSIIEFVNRALEPFGFEEAKSIFESSKSFDISSLGNEKRRYF